MEELNFYKVSHYPNNGEPYFTYASLPVHCTRPANSLEISKEEYLRVVSKIIVY